MKKITFEQDFIEVDGSQYEARHICASHDEASKLATKLSKRHTLARQRFAFYRVSDSGKVETAQCNLPGWHVTYYATACYAEQIAGR